VVPFDIPVEAFAVEVGGGAHPAVRSLGDRRHVYVEHRQNLRRAYRRRQLCLALGLSGAFVVVAAVGLVPQGAEATAPAADATAAPTRPAAPLVAVAAAVHGRAWQHSRRPWRTPHLREDAPLRAVPPGRDLAPDPVGSVVGYHGRPLAEAPFLVCTRRYESANAGGYTAVSRGGRYRGAYQFDRITWDATARHLGRTDLVGADPAATVPVLQDLLAYTLYKWRGASHWNYRCDGLA
jgi:hypothetical protein